jgi:DNA-directed RNA polymerase subunit beta'
MLSTNNILKPSDGKPVTMPTQDMVIGLFWLTTEKKEADGEGRAFSTLSEAIMAYDRNELDLQATVQVRVKDVPPPRDWTPPEGYEE